jgi:hypothetical protein
VILLSFVKFFFVQEVMLIRRIASRLWLGGLNRSGSKVLEDIDIRKRMVPKTDSLVVKIQISIYINDTIYTFVCCYHILPHCAQPRHRRPRRRHHHDEEDDNDFWTFEEPRSGV